MSYVFDHPVNHPQWYFESDEPGFAGTEQDYAVLLGETFRRAGDDLQRFSDAQVNQGIWFLASPSGSDVIFSLRDGPSALDDKIAGIHAIYLLYRDCFAKRRTESLGHLDEPEASDLNPICYIFWDVCPLSWLEKAGHKEELENAVFSVLSDTLKIPHRACIEGGLHGLGHMAHQYPDRVAGIIDEFLRKAPLDPELEAYAVQARTGCIQ